MLTLLTAAAISVVTPIMGTGLHDFRLPAEIAARNERRCPAGPVCAFGTSFYSCGDLLNAQGVPVDGARLV